MINKYKENTKHYICLCSKCRSQFTFQYEDIHSGYSNSNCYIDYVKCPYCDERNKVGKLLKPTKKDYHNDLIKITELKDEIQSKDEEIEKYKDEMKKITSIGAKNIEDLSIKLKDEKDKNLVLENKIKDFIIYNKKLNDTVNAYSIHFASKKSNISKKELLTALDDISDGIEVK